MSNDGWSKVAKKVEKPWSKKTKRPKEWIGNLGGLCLHTCGQTLPANAKKANISPTTKAINYYRQSYGTHYVCGWADNELYQVANEEESANGVGVTEQRDKDQKGQVESVAGKYSGSWEKDLPATLVSRWKERWKHTGAKNPLELFPTKYANSYYAHVEMIPCVFSVNNKTVYGGTPLREGLNFTRAQHQNVARLAVDIAERNGWPEGWQRTGRLVTHEDISPISRHDKNGGWDPGVLRATPRFDWAYLVGEIERLLGEKNVEAMVSDINSRWSETEKALTSLDKSRVALLKRQEEFNSPEKVAARQALKDRVEKGSLIPSGFLAEPGLVEPKTLWQKVVDFFVKLFKSGKHDGQV